VYSTSMSPACGRGEALKPRKVLLDKPKKRLYRARAHSNPLNDHSFEVPTTPAHVNWNKYYGYEDKNNTTCSEGEGEGEGEREGEGRNGNKNGNGNGVGQVTFLDVGCGFGGFLIKLAELYPNEVSLGLELRDKVSEYVRERIETLRKNNEEEGLYRNVAVIRANAMKDLPHYFTKKQLKKMFFLFPDPHFKVSTHRRRIVTTLLLDEYAYFLENGGMLYTITDVEDLGIWMKDHLDRHPLFTQVPDEELENDPAAKQLFCASEEAQKVTRNEGQMFRAVYRRL